MSHDLSVIQKPLALMLVQWHIEQVLCPPAVIYHVLRNFLKPIDEDINIEIAKFMVQVVTKLI